MRSISTFLCPAMLRTSTNGSKLSIRGLATQKSPLVLNIEKLEAYIKSLRKTVDRQNPVRQSRLDRKLDASQSSQVYASLSHPPQKDKHRTPMISKRVCETLSISSPDKLKPQDWSKILGRILHNGQLSILRTKEVNEVFAMMTHKDRCESAQRLLSEAQFVPDRMTYDLMMDSYASCSEAHKALEVFDLSRKAGFAPSLYSYAHLMKAFAVTKDLSKASAMHKHMQDNGVEPNLVIYTSLIATCVRALNITEAFTIFDTLKYKSTGANPDTHVYSLMIYACSLDSSLSAERAADLFEEMTAKGLRPSRETFNALIHVYSTRKEYFTEAWRVSEMMQAHQVGMDKTTWHSLLSACAVANDLPKAKKLVQELFRISQTAPEWAPDAITFQLLFRAYAAGKARRSRSPRDGVLHDESAIATNADSIWINEQPFTSDALLEESARVLRYVQVHHAEYVSTQLLDTFMTISQAFEAPAAFNFYWDSLYKVHAKGLHSYEIGLSAAYTFKDHDLLQKVWRERQEWRTRQTSVKSAPLSAVDQFRDFEATRLYIECLARLDRMREAREVLDEARSRYSFQKKDLKCFQTKSLQVGDEEAVMLYSEIFPDYMPSRERRQQRQHYY